MNGTNGLSSAAAFELAHNFQRINFLLQRLFLAVSRKEIRSPGVDGPGQPFFLRAALGQATGMVSNPMRAMATHFEFWTNTTALYAELTQAMLTGGAQQMPAEEKDNRFKEEEWSSHPFYYYLRRQYQIMSAYLESLAGAADLGDDARHTEQIHFFTRQLVDLFAPNNFLASNPVAIRKAVETNGQSLVEGLQNFVEDLERSNGDLLVTLSDPKAFEVGKTIAASKGYVIHQTEMFQLIRYEPTTEKVYSRPLVIVPPWINKFYILDLQPKSSMVKWLTDKGFAVHIVSWRNPTKEHANWGMDTYVFDGVLKAIEAVCELNDSEDCNITGYCIGGTAVSMALAWLGKQKKLKPVRSATFFTALTDFEDPGPIQSFLDESFLPGLQMEANRKGYLDNKIMARTFSFLRPNDLVYGPAVHAYLLGEPRPKFDLLFWNEDSTRLPARMAGEYLNRLYGDNELSVGRYELKGESVGMGDINIPHYVVACEKDHIAPWEASFKGLAKAGGDGRFVLAQSGHIAGIVNPPVKNKYGYWTNPETPHDLEKWREGSEEHEGSWWGDWASWLGRRSGKKIDASASFPESTPRLEAAPGSYVKK